MGNKEKFGRTGMLPPQTLQLGISTILNLMQI
jgi:hypothetical protein